MNKNHLKTIRTKPRPVLKRLLLGIGLALLVLSSLPVSTYASQPAANAAFAVDINSNNWSGYAVTGPIYSVTDVTGFWLAPSVTCAIGSTSYSAFWVGIDGFGGKTVEQIGTASNCMNGVPTYYAWYEFFPLSAVRINSLTIHPGDEIYSEVKYSTMYRYFIVSIQDWSTGKTFSTTCGTTGCQYAHRSSAEWIAEAPSIGGIQQSLANFGTAKFGTAFPFQFDFATVSQKTGVIGSFGADVQQITMTSASGAVKALPSALSNEGEAFTVTWKSAGP